MIYYFFSPNICLIFWFSRVFFFFFFSMFSLFFFFFDYFNVSFFRFSVVYTRPGLPRAQRRGGCSPPPKGGGARSPARPPRGGRARWSAAPTSTTTTGEEGGAGRRGPPHGGSEESAAAAPAGGRRVRRERGGEQGVRGRFWWRGPGHIAVVVFVLPPGGGGDGWGWGSKGRGQGRRRNGGYGRRRACLRRAGEEGEARWEGCMFYFCWPQIFLFLCFSRLGFTCRAGRGKTTTLFFFVWFAASKPLPSPCLVTFFLFQCAIIHCAQSCAVGSVVVAAAVFVVVAASLSASVGGLLTMYHMLYTMALSTPSMVSRKTRYVRS